MRSFASCVITLVLLLGVGGCKSSDKKADTEQTNQVTYKCNTAGCTKTKSADAGTPAPS